MKHYLTIEEIIAKEKPGVIISPLPIDVIPNYMGINLVSVKGVEWEEQPDGQLVWLKIHFIPNNIDYQPRK